MKRLILIGCCVLQVLFLNAQKIQRVEPLCWWTDMKTPLQLMFYGSDLANTQISVVEAGLTIKKVHTAKSPNYLFVDVEVQKTGTFTFVLKKGKKKLKYSYTIYPRREKSTMRHSFTSSDVIYLLMPDRFANGDTTNDSTSNTIEKPNRTNLQGRHGGDIQGIINHLDYIADLGATTIWSTPLLLDNEPDYTYHGYACADYYHIDPRFGSNELYKQMVSESHKRDLKVIMDIVTNHCGLSHWWITDLPFADWIHQFSVYTQTNADFSANFDINASKFDLNLQESGWFDTRMPDMNLDNPYLLHYFKQWAIWWIEYADLDGLRVDTYPYNEKYKMAEWCKAVRTEYPNINIVGECWTYLHPQVEYWEADAPNKDGFNSHLPSVMDFPLQDAICRSLSEKGDNWGEGLTRVYNSLSNDYLYNDARKLLIFTGNHDMERIADTFYKNDIRRVKLAATLLATMRGVPQLFYGEEIMLHSKDRTQGHGGLRTDFPGGWAQDTQNAFDAEKRTVEQQDLYTYYQRLFTWRKTEPIIHSGKTLHFLSRDNTYAFFRYTAQGAVFVFLNASETNKNISWKNYEEITNNYQPTGVNILTKESVDIHQILTVQPLSSVIVKFDIPK